MLGNKLSLVGAFHYFLFSFSLFLFFTIIFTVECYIVVLYSDFPANKSKAVTAVIIFSRAICSTLSQVLHVAITGQYLTSREISNQKLEKKLL